jgi:DNA-binding GntR family transcriptional regulator
MQKLPSPTTFAVMPIPRSHTRSDAAYRALKAKILAGSIPRGNPLREHDVADQLELGRTPVREALKRLEDEGLLVHEPRHGLVVRSFDRQAVIELYAMREVLEGAAARFAASQATPADHHTLDALLDGATVGSDPVRANLVFHQAIYAIARNRFLGDALSAITDSTYLLGASTLESPERVTAAHDEHKTIARAIRSGDADAAAAAMQAHIRNALFARLAMLATAEIA